MHRCEKKPKKGNDFSILKLQKCCNLQHIVDWDAQMYCKIQHIIALALIFWCCDISNRNLQLCWKTKKKSEKVLCWRQESYLKSIGLTNVWKHYFSKLPKHISINGLPIRSPETRKTFSSPAESRALQKTFSNKKTSQKFNSYRIWRIRGPKSRPPKMTSERQFVTELKVFKNTFLPTKCRLVRSQLRRFPTP